MKPQSKKQRDILLSAVTEFASRGYDNASIDTIAANAHVAKGTVFYHYDTKEALFAAILAEGRETLDARIRQGTAGAGNPLDKLMAVIDIETEYIAQYRDFFRVFMTEALKTGATLDGIERIIEEGKRTGTFRQDLNAKAATIAVQWLTALTVMEGQDSGLKDILLTGILAR